MRIFSFPDRRFRILMVLVLLLLLLLGTAVLAQDEPPQIDPGSLYTWQDFLEEPSSVWVQMLAAFGVMASLVAAVYKVLAARFWPDGLQYTALVAFLSPILMTLGYFAVDSFGFGDTFVTSANFLLVAVPTVMTFFGVSVFSGAAYKVTKLAGTAYWGDTSTALMARMHPPKAVKDPHKAYKPGKDDPGGIG